MPIDFKRIPPRIPVPPPPRPSIILWTFLLASIVALGAGLTVALWPKSTPSHTLWFWCCAAIYPIFVWSALLCCSLGIGYARRSEAMAINRVNDSIEQERHTLASMPLAVLGHAWCFSSNDEENDAQGVFNGTLHLDFKPSVGQLGTDVRARWLEIPGDPFYSGNVLLENVRHEALCDWVLGRLIERIGGPLKALPSHTILHVDLCLKSLVNPDRVEGSLQKLILAKAPSLQIKITGSPDHVSLFRVDDWHGQLRPGEAVLLLSLHFRRSISELLDDGDAEAGVALLVARPGAMHRDPSLRLHRPATGTIDAEGEPFARALRWGGVEASQIHTIWSHALADDLAHPVKAAPQFSQDLQWTDVSATVGQCDGTGPWLALVLALEHARLTGGPELVLSQQGDELIALVCKTST
ncbi:hypothetical protein [Cupriavidus pinatubonensis]|uniref:Transmembrane protein n=1 Tax=Cupriavidus pinatubonensis TaxID=248026 RepID=A0ABM8WKX9_9BURK|nr:hypothetical protein [Cupriavidus pinatubonensis]CAG9168041.1 hypothetical protein LMG23994_01286 [Cupriavidus pinatubonensis]